MAMFQYKNCLKDIDETEKKKESERKREKKNARLEFVNCSDGER